MSKKNSQLTFRILRLDPMGQGVHKDDEGVAFIPKTLPGEEGQAHVTQSKKGVRFAKLAEIHKKAPERRAPDCPHYQECPSCHYQHVDYGQELQHKENSLRQHLRKILGAVAIQMHPCPERYGQRNRVQLHYDLKLKQLGLVNGHQLLPIPECLLPNPEVQAQLKAWYADDWVAEFQQRGVPTQGHVEIYQREGKIQVTFNSAYAAGGFTQVNQAMNSVLKNLALDWSSQAPTGPVLDLFGGNGNLSSLITDRTCWVVDAPSDRPKFPEHQRFLPQDLYDSKALKHLQEALPKDFLPSVVILDPPRSGLKNAADFLKIWPAPMLIYVSCWPSTMARDLESLGDAYRIQEVHLVDLFPATFHYESAVLLIRNPSK